MKFKKPAINSNAQIALLRSRGLVVPDEDKAKHYLKYIGYYRLAGYALPFQVNHNQDGSHQFLTNASFEDVLDLYIFDRKLRLLVTDELERIEVAFRSELSQTMSEAFGPHWYTSSKCFIERYNHTDFIDLLKKDIGFDPSKSAVRQRFIDHYFKKYCDPKLPPSWMIFEILSFGTVSQVFKNLSRENQKLVAKSYGLDGSVLASWMHSITYLRNLAAHHQRLWNRSYTIKPIIAKQYASELSEPTRFYAQAIIIQVLLKVVAPESQWANKLGNLFAAHPKVNIQQMGFPHDWQTREIWKVL